MKKIIDSELFTRTLKRIAHQIIESNNNLDEVILVGIEKKGTPLAKLIASYIELFESKKITVLSIDISKHRDDDKKNENVKINLIEAIDNKVVILVDDVLYTGRSVRAAMDALMDFGRPRKIQLAVLIDRGHRELPIMADYVGKNVPTSRNEKVICDIDIKEVSIL